MWHSGFQAAPKLMYALSNSQFNLRSLLNLTTSTNTCIIPRILSNGGAWVLNVQESRSQVFEYSSTSALNVACQSTKRCLFFVSFPQIISSFTKELFYCEIIEEKAACGVRYKTASWDDNSLIMTLKTSNLDRQVIYILISKLNPSSLCQC